MWKRRFYWHADCRRIKNQSHARFHVGGRQRFPATVYSSAQDATGLPRTARQSTAFRSNFDNAGVPGRGMQSHALRKRKNGSLAAYLPRSIAGRLRSSNSRISCLHAGHTACECEHGNGSSGKSRLVDALRGAIHVTNRSTLEKACCDCYKIIVQQTARWRSEV